jgi:hypothetical protein
MWGQPPRLSAERSDALFVWSGHSCPLPLTLLLTLSFEPKMQTASVRTEAVARADGRLPVKVTSPY